MTLDKAVELLKIQADLAGGYNLNAAKLILAEVSREHGQAAVNRLIEQLQLETAFGFKPDQQFS